MARQGFETTVYDHEPVIGERVGMRSVGQAGRDKWDTRSEGVYQGIVESEDGPIHLFTDGIIGTTPQTSFGHPVGTRDGLAEHRTI